MQAHKETYVKVAANAGVTILTEIVDEFAGLPIPAVVEEINKRYNSTFNPVEFESLNQPCFIMSLLRKLNRYILLQII